MPDGSTKPDLRTIRTYLLNAEQEIIELHRQIAERDRHAIPTIGLEAALDEAIAERDVLRVRLEQAESKQDG